MIVKRNVVERNLLYRKVIYAKRIQNKKGIVRRAEAAVQTKHFYTGKGER